MAGPASKYLLRGHICGALTFYIGGHARFTEGTRGGLREYRQATELVR